MCVTRFVLQRQVLKFWQYMQSFIQLIQIAYATWLMNIKRVWREGEERVGGGVNPREPRLGSLLGDIEH